MTRPLEARGTQSSISRKERDTRMSVHTSTSGDIYITLICFCRSLIFLGEDFHCSQDLFGRAYGRFIIRILSFSSHKPLGLQPLLPMK
jgi:hypothetical protein